MYESVYVGDMTKTNSDDGRLLRALEPLLDSLATTENQSPFVRLSREASRGLWDAFILDGRPATRARHGMLLGPEAWPNLAASSPAPLPLDARHSAPRWWVVFWMRERAAVVAGRNLERSLDDLLAEDDEAVIAINTDNLDSLQSWGGDRRWVIQQRPGVSTPRFRS